METRTVYRVEHATRDCGPFDDFGGEELSDVLASAGYDTGGYFHTEERGFPNPYYDRGLSNRARNGDLDGYVCGCRSAKQLARWFPAPLAAFLDRNGYEVTVWNVPREAVAYGSAQVMFDRDLARCVEQRPVSTLHA